MKDDKVSKVTQVLINDLKGRRVVNHNFHEQNNRTLGGNIADQRKNQKEKNKPWWKRITSWEAITGLIILALLSLVATAFYSIFRKPKSSTEKITYNYIAPKKKKSTTTYKKSVSPVQKKKKRNYSKSRKKRSISPRKSKPKKDTIYSWRDKNGIVHFTNNRGNVNKESVRPKPKKTILGYTVRLKNGKRIECKKVLKIGKGTIRIIEKNIETEMSVRDVSTIEEKSRNGGKNSIRFINPESI
jgi:hypothetical protein